MVQVGPYELLAPLGRSAAGAAHRARDTRTGAEVALRLLAVPADDPAKRRRLEREADALARLRHPNVASLIDRGEHEGRPFLVSELVLGEGLAARLEQGPLPPREAAAVLHDVARGLEHAHAQGALHRDLKPRDVILGPRGPVLVGFGLTLEVDAARAALGAAPAPGHWSPEQAGGDVEALGPATDVWGLGVLLHAALTGRPPARGEPIRAAGLDPALARLTGECLAPEPARRPASAGVVAGALDRWLTGESDRTTMARAGASPAPTRPPTSSHAGWAAAAIVLGGVAAGGWASTRRWSIGAGPAPTASVAEADPQAWLDRAAARLDAGDAAGARAAADRALALAGEGSAAGPRAARALLLRGRARLALGDEAGALEDWSAAVVRDPDLAAAWVERGAARLRRGEADEALADLTRAVEVGPRAAEAWAERARAHAAREALDLAAEDVERALRLDPTQGLALVERARAAALRDQDDALPLAEEAVAAAPLLARAWAARGLARARRGDLTRAADDAAQALRLDAGCADAFALRARLRERRGDAQGALDDAARAARLGPAVARYRLDRAALRRARGDVQGALEDARAAAALAPGSGEAQLELGLARAALGDRPGALEALGEALRLEPRRAAAYAERSRLRQALQDAAGALEDASRALELAPGDWRLWAHRAALREGAGGLADLDEAVALAPGDPGPRGLRAAARQRQGDAAGAAADWGELLDRPDLDPSAQREALRGRATARAALGRWDEAEDDLDRLLDLDPADGAGRAARARARLLRRDLRGALEDADRAVAGGVEAARLERALARQGLGEARAALEDWDGLVQAAPDDARLRVNRAGARLALRDARGAADDLERALAADPTLGGDRAVQLEAFDGLGQAHEALGEWAPAAAAWDRLLDLDPARTRARLRRAAAREATGDLRGAVADLVRSIRELPPGAPEVELAKVALARLAAPDEEPAAGPPPAPPR